MHMLIFVVNICPARTFRNSTHCLLSPFTLDWSRNLLHNPIWNMAVNNISYSIYPLSTRTEKGYITEIDTFLFLFSITSYLYNAMLILFLFTNRRIFSPRRRWNALQSCVGSAPSPSDLWGWLCLHVSPWQRLPPTSASSGIGYRPFCKNRKNAHRYQSIRMLSHWVTKNMICFQRPDTRCDLGEKSRDLTVYQRKIKIAKRQHKNAT